MPRPIVEIALIIVAIYVAVGAFLYFFQRSMIYYPDGRDFHDCPGFKDSEKVVRNGTRMYHGHNSDRIVVYYHGNAGSACDRAFIKDRFEELGYSYLFVEYAGYSGDSRTPTKELLLADAENAAEFVGEKGYPEVVVAGSSLGTAMASYHAATAGAGKVLLVAPFDAVANVAREIYFFYPVKLLLKDDYDNRRWLKDYDEELLIIHPGRDSVVSVERGRALYEELDNGEKEFVELPEVGHNQVFTDETAWNAIADFLR